MQRARQRALQRIVAVTLLLGVSASALGQSAQTPLKEPPKDGDLPLGVVVYVDDRKCPRGEIKEITGGSREKDIARRTRCVPRPAQAPAR